MEKILENLKWRTLIALTAIYVGTFMNWGWPWGVLFLMWAVPAIPRGRVEFVESVSKDQNPIVFWLLVGSWIALALLFFAWDLGIVPA